MRSAASQLAMLPSHAGANVIVAGTAIFGAKDPADTIAKMKAFVAEKLAAE